MEEPMIDLIKTVAPSLVGIAAIGFAYLNNREQRKVQLESTIEKEWRKEVRDNLSIILHHSSKMGHQLIHKKVVDEAFSRRYLESDASLRLLLNPYNELERKLLDEIEKLSENIFDVKDYPQLFKLEAHHIIIIDLMNQAFKSRTA
jgi:hypothetical protein